jgi:heavy metal sensor kinase
MSFFKTIKFRITVWYLLVIMALLACFGTVAYIMLSYQLHRTLDESLVSKAIEYESSLKAEDGEITFSAQPNDLVLVYDASGTLLHRLGPDVNFAKTDNLVRLALLGENSFASESLEGEQVRLYATPFTLSPDTRLAIIIGRPPTEIAQTLGTVRSAFLVSAFLAVILAIFGGLMLSNRVLYPVRRITGKAENINETNLNHRIEVHSEDELGKLASTLNGMIERLEVAFIRQRQFAADVSHELRTPLSVIQAESTLALGKERTSDDYRRSLEVVSQEVEFMSTVLGNLLLLARGEVGREILKSENVNIKNILVSLSANIEVLAHDKGLEYSFELNEDLPVEGDPVKLKQLFTNILENAIKYTPSGGSISGSAISKDGSVVVSIADTGVGIPRKHLPFIFDRFYRVDKARSRADGGAGLGLSIAKYIAEAHSGKIEVESTMGKGSVFHVFLPINEIACDSAGPETTSRPKMATSRVPV